MLFLQELPEEKAIESFLTEVLKKTLPAVLIFPSRWWWNLDDDLQNRIADKLSCKYYAGPRSDEAVYFLAKRTWFR